MSLVSMVSKIKDAWLNNIYADKCPFCGELGLDNFSAHYDEVRGHHRYMLNTCTYCNKTVDLFTKYRRKDHYFSNGDIRLLFL